MLRRWDIKFNSAYLNFSQLHAVESQSPRRESKIGNLNFVCSDSSLECLRLPFNMQTKFGFCFRVVETSGEKGRVGRVGLIEKKIAMHSTGENIIWGSKKVIYHIQGSMQKRRSYRCVFRDRKKRLSSTVRLIDIRGQFIFSLQESSLIDV